MFVSRMKYGLPLLMGGILGTQGTDVSTCAELIDAIDAGGVATHKLTADMSCGETMTIANGDEITINGNSQTITLSSGFTSSVTSGSSLFQNLGSLVIANLEVTEDTNSVDSTEPGVRVVHNEGTLEIRGCTFEQLNERSASQMIELGGAIYSSSVDEISISDSFFNSNTVSGKGGAIYVDGSETLAIGTTEFKNNEATNEDDTGTGGDVYAGDKVTLTVELSNFTSSTADYAGAAIACCGGEITSCNFVGTETYAGDGNYGALTTGLPDGSPCGKLTVSSTNFDTCSSSSGVGSSLSAFDTFTSISDSVFEGSSGTALYFRSTDPDSYTLEMDNVEFNENTDGSTLYAADDVEMGTAMVLEYYDADEEAVLAEFNGVYCFGNDPYECEFVYSMSSVVYAGEFKCNICDESGERQIPNTDDDDNSGERSVDDGSSSDSNSGIVIGLSLALGITLVIIGGLAVWKHRVRKNARRLMEDMGDGDL